MNIRELAERLALAWYARHKVTRKMHSATDVYTQLVALGNELHEAHNEPDTDNCPSDCGDNSCDCASQRTGMRTNGGCRCDERALRRAVRYWRKRANG